jgi:hypothetical protein
VLKDFPAFTVYQAKHECLWRPFDLAGHPGRLCSAPREYEMAALDVSFLHVPGPPRRGSLGLSNFVLKAADCGSYALLRWPVIAVKSNTSSFATIQ